MHAPFYREVLRINANKADAKAALWHLPTLFGLAVLELAERLKGKEGPLTKAVRMARTGYATGQAPGKSYG